MLQQRQFTMTLKTLEICCRLCCYK